MADQMLSERFADVLAPLNEQQRRGVVQALANGHLEGWRPTRAEVADLVDVELGRITDDEYTARVLDRAQRMASQPSATV